MSRSRCTPPSISLSKPLAGIKKGVTKFQYLLICYQVMYEFICIMYINLLVIYKDRPEHRLSPGHILLIFRIPVPN